MEGIRGTLHPLQTPIVLECIFEHLDDIKDLKKCRLVCKTWRDTNRRAMRASTEVTIRCDESNPRGISKFLELVENKESSFLKDKPLADHFILRVGKGDSPEFWKTIGAHIKFLKMIDVEFQSTESFRHAIFQSCPNLERLELLDVSVHGERVREPKEWVPPKYSQNANLQTLQIYGIGGEFSISWLEILSNFPGLQKLSIGEIGDGDRFEDAFSALEIARQYDATCWNLTKIEVYNETQTTHVPSFNRLFGGHHFNLTSLGIRGIDGNSQEDVISVQKILIAHAATLKELDLEQISNDHPVADIFLLPSNQVFENVEVLKLGIKWTSSRFLQAFPNVKKLTLEVNEIPEDIHTPNVTLDNCTQLTFYNQIFEDGELERLLNLLPNLEKLQISDLDNTWFSKIFEAWPNLTHLYLFHGPDVDEMGLTGYDQKDVRKINRKGRRGWRPITVRRANLTSLKKLQSFCWKLREDEYSKLGYCSVACGVLELPELKYLCVELENKENVPLPLFDFLAGRFTWNNAQEKMFE